jgi:putative DNA primase/helicase
MGLIKFNIIQETKIINNINQFGLIKRIEDTYKNRLYYLKESKVYVIWTGEYWAKCDNIELIRMVMDVINKIPNEINNVIGVAKTENGDMVTAKDLKKFQKSVSSDTAIKPAISLLPTCKNLVASESDFDTVTDHIVTQNGILNLRTGILEDHNPEFKSTKIAPVPYIKNADCPKFKKFIYEIFMGNEELIKYIQVLLGYLITGLTIEQKIFIFRGYGSNGKSKLVNILRKVLGDYAIDTPSSTFLKKPSNSIPSDLPRLKDARVIFASESNLGQIFDMAIIKLCTGSDMVTARNLFESFYSFTLQAKVVFITNIVPEIKSFDYGSLRRIEIIPFDRKFKDEEDNKYIEDELTKELTGIFAWIVEGATQYLEKGLPKCDAVQKSTTNYLTKVDIIQDFLNDCCEINIEDKNYRISVADLKNLFEIWAKKNGVDGYSKIKLSDLMELKGFEQGHSGSVRQWKGISIKSKLHSKP